MDADVPLRNPITILKLFCCARAKKIQFAQFWPLTSYSFTYLHNALFESIACTLQKKVWPTVGLGLLKRLS